MKRPLYPTLALLLALAACGDDGTPPDAGDAMVPDGDTDGGGPGLCPVVPELGWSRASVGMTPGVTRTVKLDLNRDFICETKVISLTATTDGIASFPDSVTLDPVSTQARVTFSGVAAGTTTVTATWSARGEMRTASLDVIVTDTTVPGCEGMATGRLDPGGSITIATGPATGAGIELPAGAARDDIYHVDPFDVTVTCAADQIPDGYVALGPAVSLDPAALRFTRELPVTIPVREALLPEGRTRGDITFSYTGPGVSEPRVVPMAEPWIEGDPDAGLLHFVVPRLGTYQPIALAAARTRRDRTYVFHGITGVSMGSGGAGLIGMNNPERFDFVAPLGGPIEWRWMLHYIRTYHTGGFCTEDERVADPAGCAAGSSYLREPPPDQLFEFVQDFEHWHYDDGWDGQGGTFDREEYVQIFRDLGMMYGNLNSDRSTDPTAPNVTPPGIDDSDRMRSDSDRCTTPVVIPPCSGAAPMCDTGTGFVDDEFNPEGSYPVITFCDGPEIRIDGRRDVGIWDPAADQFYPVEVALAVDLNANGVRDQGEPVIRNGREPWDDCGLDRLCNPDEPGYDAATNPDPAGDDYDYQFNPGGTEGNYTRDGDPCDEPGGEAFLDSGLDGVIGTRQLDDGGFDNGEGNGCWDMSAGWERMAVERNPRTLAEEMPFEDLRDIDILTDGGIRDLFNFGVVANHFAGVFIQRNLPLNVYNSHGGMLFSGPIADNDFVAMADDIDYDEIGKRVLIRYGHPDAELPDLEMGDGGHVGTIPQALNRILGALSWMSARWPEGDRTIVQDRICTVMGPGCDHVNQFVLDFTASTGRTGPVTIVLPPGYFQEEFADVGYPIVYFGHGYGMEPDDLLAIGIIIWNFMISRQIPEAKRLQKMIFVFPDGRCRGDECIQGTFYADAPESTPGGAQMETFMLDLMDHISANYRVRAPETVEIIE